MSTQLMDLSSGCAPSVDGVLHADEWSDGKCFNVPLNGTADTVVYAKYSGDAVYLATSGVPTCGCPLFFFFDPMGAGTPDGGQYAISVFDDPFHPDGDRSELAYNNGTIALGTAPAGIITACPSPQPNPIRYEWKVPFSALGITAATGHTFRMAIVHDSAKWPQNLAVNGNGVPSSAQDWGSFYSSSLWH